LYTNTFYLWLSAFSVSLLGFAFWTLVARLYSPEEVGIGGAVVTSLIVLSQVSQLGLGHTLIRFIPQSGQEALLLLSRSLIATVAASMFIGLVFLSTLPLWSEDLRDLLWNTPVRAGSFLIFVVIATLWVTLNPIFIAYRRAVFVLALNLVALILRLLLVVPFGVLGSSAMGIVAGHGLAILGGTLLAMLVFLPRCTGRLGLPLAFDVWRLIPQAPFSLSNLTSHALTVLVWQLLPLPVMALAGAKAAGFFYVAWAVAGIILVMMQQLALSLFAEGSNASRGFRSQAWGALVVGISLGTLFAVATYFLGDLVLLFFGSEYVEQSSNVLKVLAAATPFAAVTYVYLGIERIRQRLALLVMVSVMVTVVMLGATAVLVPRMGIVGAGFGVVAGYGVGALLSLLLLYPVMKGASTL
jgi:O-antigen/teichoic acid export membrane protein